jgi:S1/P1 nuclease
MHLVGDVHQPLHAVTFYSKQRFPNGDKGGNDILVKGKRSLHSTWDAFLGTSESVRYLETKVADYLKDPELEQAADGAARSLSVDDWVDESHELAVDFAYDAAIVAAAGEIEASGSRAKPSTELPPSYFSEGKQHARRRAVQAGYRLAALLQKLL